jgi:eukaryotic-like serine/threonine-protein kinase
MMNPGDKLGPYEILSLLGKGGMGEVYRAHDDRLRRDVAIKVSNAQFTERFTREARTVASLNHTNIAHLYDVGPNYLVMELVEGEDLKGPMSLDDALPIIQQLIDGIEAAHEKNIVHRDLKPANIKITPDGIVKILDFGLAKAMDPTPTDSAAAAVGSSNTPRRATHHRRDRHHAPQHHTAGKPARDHQREFGKVTDELPVIQDLTSF